MKFVIWRDFWREESFRFSEVNPGISRDSIGRRLFNEAPMDSVITQVSANPATNAENSVNNDTSGGSSGGISPSGTTPPTSVPATGSSNTQLQASSKGKLCMYYIYIFLSKYQLHPNTYFEARNKRVGWKNSKLHTHLCSELINNKSKNFSVVFENQE